MASPFIGVYKALYAYTAATEQELTVAEGDLLYLLEKADDGWWTVKLRVPGASETEPQGIVPHNYVAPATPIGSAKALYSYQQQTPEELSFDDNAEFDVYVNDGDWVLVGRKASSNFGFVPVNYIQLTSGDAPPTISKAKSNPASFAPPPAHPSVAQSNETATAAPAAPAASDSEEEAPPKPPRPNERPFDRQASDAHRERQRERELDRENEAKRQQPKFRSWAVQEIAGRRKSKSTLALSTTNVLLTPERGPQQQWEVENLRSYSSEKKHIFLELDKPQASLELRVSSQDIADQIVAVLGQLAGARRGGGLTEVLVAAKSAGQKEAKVTRDYSDRYISLREGDTVFVLEKTDKQSWLVRATNGDEGSVPAKIIDLGERTGLAGAFGFKRKDKGKERERERERDRDRDRERERDRDRRDRDRERERERDRDRDRHRDRDRDHDRRRDKARHQRTNSRPLPDMRKVRTWTDRSATFRVEASLLGYADGKIHLHKTNGVKIAVPAAKLSLQDIEYVEGITGIVLDDDKPLVSKAGTRRSRTPEKEQKEPAKKKSDYDWFNFFLECGVEPQNCQRYSDSFVRDQMDEKILPDITPQVLRSIGLREGDILRVTKHISEKFGPKSAQGGLYSAEDGGLKNNTSRSRLPDNDEEAWKPRDTPKDKEPQPKEQPQPAQAQPQPAQAQPQPTQAQPQPMSQPRPTSQPIQARPTGSLGEFMQPLQPQKTAEQYMQEAQASTQRMILKQQADLQTQQIQLLKKQQDQLKKQQDSLLDMQRTGLEMQKSGITALGPFATGIAQLSTGIFNNNSAAQGSAVLAQRTGPLASAQGAGFDPFRALIQPTGPAAPTTFGPAAPTTFGPAAPTTFGPAAPTTFGPAAPATSFGPAPQTPHLTGPFQNQNTGVQNQNTGFQQQNTGFQQQNTGFRNQNTGFQQGPPAQPFQPQRTGPFQPQALPAQRTGPFQPQALPAQRTGPFQQQPTGTLAQFTGSIPQTSFQSRPASAFPTGQSQPPASFQTTGGFATLPPNRTGGFQSTPSQPMSFSSAPATPFQPLPQTQQQFNQVPQQFPQQQFSQAPQQLPQATQPPFPQANQLPFQPAQAPQAQAPSTLFPQPPQQQPAFTPNSFGQPLVGGPQGKPTLGMLQQQRTQPTPQPSFGAPAGQQSFNMSSMSQALPGGGVLQSQPTGFGFGNQPLQQQQQTGPRRADLNVASASNPFGF